MDNICTFYRMHNPILRPDVWVEIDRKFAIFLAKEEYELIRGNEIKAYPGDDINSNTIHRTDILNSIGGPDIVSKKFKDRLGQYLSAEVEFFPVVLSNNFGIYRDWFVMQPLKKLELINHDAPVVNFEEGFPRDKVIFFMGKKVMYNNADDFSLAVDIINDTYMFCSENFFNICKKQQINIDFSRQLCQSHVRVSDLDLPNMI